VNLPIHDLHRAFESRIRLGIMSALAANASMDFNTLKELLDLTDGNLASHLKGLEKEDFIVVEKSFVGRKTNTRYAITPAGRQAFEQHLAALEALIRAQPNGR
jgi:DNA-binding MarR family transcriptional regulator